MKVRKYFSLHNWRIQFEVISGGNIVTNVINVNVRITVILSL